MSATGISTPGSFIDNQQVPFDSKLMVAAIIVLFLVMLFIFCLHVYAKWFWRHSSALRSAHRATPSWTRRRFEFTGQDPFIVVGSVGLDKDVIGSLPTFVYQAPPAADQAVLECAVCLCEFEDEENGRLLPKCNHSFHKECIDMWFYSHSTCPLCRTIVTSESLPAAQHEQPACPQASASSSAPSQISGESRTLDELQCEMQRSEAAISTASLLPTEDNTARDEECFPSSRGMAYPVNVVFWSNENQRSPRLSSQSPGRSHTASLPQIAIDIQRRADNLASSLSLPRSPSTDEQSCSSPGGQPLKSPTSLRNSIRRLLSRERRVFPSDREGELEQDSLLVSPV